MIDIHSAYQTIVSQVYRQSTDPVGIHIDDLQQIAGWIAKGNGDSLVTNETIEQEIRNVADWTRQQTPSVRNTHSIKEWRGIVRSAFGPALVQLDFADSTANVGRALKAIIEQELNAHIAGYAKRGTALGVWLFSQPTDPSFSIGPVCFESRQTWLDRVLDCGDITKVTHRRLSKAFSGQTLRKRSSSPDEAQEHSILSAIGNAPTVCTVITHGLAPETTKRRAILAARLALTSISLLWATPSNVLDHFRLSTDHGWRIIRTVPVTPGPRMIGGSRVVGMPPGFPIASDDWCRFAYKNRSFLCLAGKMIACWTSKETREQASTLLLNYSQSVFFFWKACREESDVMAVVEYVAALESLASGGKEAGIRQLLAARLDMEEDDLFYKEKTLRQVIKSIYRTGRSQTIHGRNSEIVQDWSGVRALTEAIARVAIVSSIDWFNKNPNETDPKELMKPTK